MRPTTLFRLVVPLVVLLANPVLADEVQLSNGDRYTGDVVKLDGGKLTFKTPHGSLDIPWSDVSALSVEKPILVRVGEAPAMLQQGGAIDVKTVTALSRPEPPLVVTGGANAGLLQTGGNTDVNSLRMDGEVVARASANRYTVGGAVNRAEDDGDETARNASISLRYDRFLTKRVYLNGNGIFTNDRFRDLDLRSAVGAGIGYQVLDTAVAKLSVDGGLGYVNENFAIAPDDSYGALREATKLDLFVVRDRVTLFHLNDGYFGVTGEDNLFVKMQNGVRLGLVGGLVTTAQLDVDYDRSPSPGRKQTDRAFALTFGYRF